jgi:hypothetical protein
MGTAGDAIAITFSAKSDVGVPFPAQHTPVGLSIIGREKDWLEAA